jgi:hypothetical protein
MQGVVGVIDGLEGGHPRSPLIAEIPDNLADGGVIFLFDIAIVVFMGGAAPGKVYSMEEAPAVNGFVDKFATGVRMDTL